MPFLNTIIAFINDTLKSSSLNDKKFQPGKYFNAVSVIPMTSDEKTTLIPGIIDETGEVEEVIPDDTYNIQLYHKINSNVYGNQKRGSVGDGYDILCTTDVSVFVFAQSDKIGLTTEQLEPLIIFGLPQNLNMPMLGELKIKSCLIIPFASDMDKLRNFRNEFQNVENFLAPNHIFFSVRYQIKQVFDQSCIDYCLTCNS